MSKESTRNQLADILAREKRKLGLDKTPTPEQHVYKKAEEVSKDVVNGGRFILAELKSAKKTYDRTAMKQHMQKQFAHRFENGFTKEELAFLLSVVFTDELITNVET